MIHFLNEKKILCALLAVLLIVSFAIMAMPTQAQTVVPSNVTPTNKQTGASIPLPAGDKVIDLRYKFNITSKLMCGSLYSTKQKIYFQKSENDFKSKSDSHLYHINFRNLITQAFIEVP